MARKKTSRSKNTPADPTDFGDLDPIEPAPDEVRPPPVVPKADRPKPKVAVAPKLEPKKREIVLKASEVIAAITSGSVSGLPTKEGFNPVHRGDEIVLIGESSEITVAMAGYAVKCELVSEIRLVKWLVDGEAADVKDKWRLMNEVRMALGGRVVTLQRNKEFFGHQIPIEDVKRAGGVLIPVGEK